MHLYHIYMLLQYKNDPATIKTYCETSKADSFTFEVLPRYFTIVAVQR